jgi:hypothetical protein
VSAQQCRELSGSANSDMPAARSPDRKLILSRDRLRQPPGRSVQCAGVHVVRLVGGTRLQRYNTSSRDLSRRTTDAQIAERWRATGSQIRSRLLFSCNSSESRGNIAFLHFVIPDTSQRTCEGFLDIKVDGRNPHRATSSETRIGHSDGRTPRLWLRFDNLAICI